MIILTYIGIWLVCGLVAFLFYSYAYHRSATDMIKFKVHRMNTLDKASARDINNIIESGGINSVIFGIFLLFLIVPPIVLLSIFNDMMYSYYLDSINRKDGPK